MPVEALECPNCGAPLPDPAGRVTITCRHCQSLIGIRPVAGLATPVVEKPGPLVLDLPARPASAAEPPDANRTPYTPDEPIPPAVAAELKRLVQAGKRVEAVKYYHQHGQGRVSLAGARDVVEAVAAGLESAAPLAALPAGGAGPRDLARIQDLLRQRRKIEAIKEYRNQTGLGLKESKDAVEAIAAATPGVPARLAKPEPASQGCLFMLLIVVAFALLLMGGCGAYTQTTGLYACAMDEIKANAAVQAALGQPVSGGYLVLSTGFSQSVNVDGSSQMSLGYLAPVWGPDGSGWVSVQAAQDADGDRGMRARLFTDWRWQPIASWHDLTCR